MVSPGQLHCSRRRLLDGNRLWKWCVCSCRQSFGAIGHDSDDGITWATQRLRYKHKLADITYGNGSVRCSPTGESCIQRRDYLVHGAPFLPHSSVAMQMVIRAMASQLMEAIRGHLLMVLRGTPQPGSTSTWNGCK